MHPTDEEEFERVVGALSVATIRRGKNTDAICVDGVEIQYERSSLVGNVLASGRISIATTGWGIEESISPLAAKNAEAVYKKLRAWLKRHYRNNMVCYSEIQPIEVRKVVAVNMFWLGPYAEQWLKSQSGLLKQYHSANVYFAAAF